MSQLTTRAIVVAGGAGAIGEAVARGLTAEGAAVAVVDISERVVQVADRMRGERKGASTAGVVAIQADLSDPAQAERSYAEATSQLGEVYAFVHCAGIYPRTSVFDLEPDEWDHVQAVNARSYFLCAKLALSDMVQRGHGRVIGLGSGLGVVSRPRSSAYAASKAAVMAFTRAAAAELGNADVTINCVNPGLTETPMMRGANTDEEVRAAVSRTGRPVTNPSELVPAMLFLLSPAGRAVSGTSFWFHVP